MGKLELIAAVGWLGFFGFAWLSTRWEKAARSWRAVAEDNAALVEEGRVTLELVKETVAAMNTPHGPECPCARCVSAREMPAGF